MRSLLWKALNVTLLALAVAVFMIGCGGASVSNVSSDGEPKNEVSGSSASVGETTAIVWGEKGGNLGVVLAHGAAYDAASWENQGRMLGENGMIALALEDTKPYNILSAISYLKEKYGVHSVALIGASAGAGPVLEAAEGEPKEVNQVILLSGTGGVSGLGEYPKLFVASEGEEIADRARRMAGEAPGDENEALILSGDAHAQAIFQTDEGDRLMQAILERLEEYG